MKKALKRIKYETYYYENNKKIIGVHSGISGDVSGISGNVSGIRGNVSEIRGDVFGIKGDVSGISGNIDLCEIIEEDRQKGIKIKDLIEN